MKSTEMKTRFGASMNKLIDAIESNEITEEIYGANGKIYYRKKGGTH